MFFCLNRLCNRSLDLWKKRHSRADNISAVVLFFDEEFGSCDPLYYDSEASTLSLGDGEDTPPLVDSLPPVLVRQLDFQDISVSFQTPVKIDSDTLCKKHCKHKRKHDEDHRGIRSQNIKYMKLGMNENIRTEVSSESLNDLQLDEMFADDEDEDVSSTKAKNSMLKPFLMP